MSMTTADPGRVLNVTGTRPPQTWSLDTDPLLVLGGHGVADEDQEFSEVFDARMVADSVIAVTDFGLLQVRTFNRRGELLARLGAPGEGPGEFRSFTRIRRCDGEDLYVLDMATSVMKVFDIEGSFVREFRLFGHNPNRPPYVWDCTQELFLTMGWGDIEFRGVGPFRPLVPLAVSGESGELMSTVGWVLGPERYWFDGGGGGSRPLGAQTGLAIRGEWIFVAEGPDYRIHRLTLDGDVDWVLVRPSERIGVDSESYVASRRPEDMSGEEARRFETRWREHEFPEFLPAIREMMIDRGGDLWVESYPALDAQEATWSVYSLEGRWIADVAIPAALQVTDIGEDYVLGIREDTLDVPEVALFALDRSGTGRTGR